MIDPTLGAVFASGFIAVLVGMIWYHPMVFGGVWARLSGLAPEMQARSKKRMPIMAFVAFLAAMLVAYVMTAVSAAWGFYDWKGGLQLGIWCWLGFVVPTMLGQVLWEQKPLRVYFINVFYWLVTFLLMAQTIVFAYGLQYATYLNTGANTDTGAYAQQE